MSAAAVTLRIEGEPRPLSPTGDLQAYRIVQEALTNALKHAGPARADVLVRYGASDLEIEVTDDGRGYDPDSDGRGHGLDLHVRVVEQVARRVHPHQSEVRVQLEPRMDAELSREVVRRDAEATSQTTQAELGVLATDLLDETRHSRLAPRPSCGRIARRRADEVEEPGQPRRRFDEDEVLAEREPDL